MSTENKYYMISKMFIDDIRKHHDETKHVVKYSIEGFVECCIDSYYYDTDTGYKSCDPGLTMLVPSTDKKGKYFNLLNTKYIVHCPKEKPCYKLVSGKYYLGPNDTELAYYLDPAKVEEWDIEYIHLCLIYKTLCKNNVLVFPRPTEISHMEIDAQRSCVESYNKLKEYVNGFKL